MLEPYAVLAARIRQELKSVESTVARAERSVTVGRQRPEDQDLFLDAAALNLHDFYAGLERVFRQVATTLEKSIPVGPDWHRELLRQMSVAIPGVRPAVVSEVTAADVDEYLRFRHVVQNIYAFQFDPERLTFLVTRMRATFLQVRRDLLTFADFLDELARQDQGNQVG